MKLFIVCVFIVLFGYVSFAGNLPDDQLLGEVIREELRGIDLDFDDLSLHADRFVRCPSQITFPGEPVFKDYVADLSPIYKALGRSGIQENLSIEIDIPDCCRKGQWIYFVRLGEYVPGTVTGKTDEKITEEFGALAVRFSYRQIRMYIDNMVKRELSPADRGSAQLCLRNESGSICLKSDILFQLPIDYGKNEYGTLDAYLIKGHFYQALGYCHELKGPVRNECYRILGEALFRKPLEKLVPAAGHDRVREYCTEAAFRSTENEEALGVGIIRDQKTGKFRFPTAGNDLITPDIRKHAFRIAAEIYVRRKEFDPAIRFYKRSGLKERNNRIGEIYLSLGDYRNAVAFFEKGHLSPYRARAYGLLADQFRRAGETEAAKKYYSRSVLEYEELIKSYNYICSDGDMEDRRRCLRARNGFLKTDSEISRQRMLEKILKITGRYCRRLKEELIYFYCREHITEKRFHNARENYEGSLVYDYQLISENKKITESRVLLRENGMIRNEKNAPLKTRFKYKNLIFGPIAFFHGSNQNLFDFKILKRESLHKKKAIVMEALPLFPRNTIGSMCGRIWINEIDYSVLKIEWHPKYLLEGFDQMVEGAWRESVSLEISSFMAFKKERDGIHFPSRFQVEEYHTDYKGKKRSIGGMEVIYRGYRFFSVGTRHRELNPGY